MNRSRRLIHSSPLCIEDAAADWLMRRDRGLTEDERREFDAWRAADPRHAHAADSFETTWQLMRKPRATGQSRRVLDALGGIDARRAEARKRAVRLSLGGLGVTAAVLVALLAPSRHRTAHGAAVEAPPKFVVLAPEQRRLPDGSIVELNAGAEIASDYSTSQRAVRLVRGSAHFSVAKDAARPFVVTAGTVAVQAVGTEFAVQLGTDDVELVVTEGRVAVERRAATVASVSAPSATRLYVDAGNGVLLAQARQLASPPTPLPPHRLQQALAWRTMRVEFTEMPLAEVLALFNRQNETQLALAELSLGDIRISGIFWSNDPAGFARLLEASAGVGVVRHDGERLVLGRR